MLHKHFYSMTEENNFSKFLQIVNKNAFIIFLIIIKNTFIKQTFNPVI